MRSMSRACYVGLDDDSLHLRRDFADFAAHYGELICVACDDESPAAPSRANRSAIARPTLRRASDQNILPVSLFIPRKLSRVTGAAQLLTSETG